MAERLSPRLAGILEALPLIPNSRVLEIGCGPGALARAMAERMPAGFVLGIDRSAKAIRQATEGSAGLLAQGVVAFRQTAAEDFVRERGEQRFDLAVAIRVGALDGRHPDKREASLKAIAAALTRTGTLFIDGGAPIQEVDLTAFR